uniref:Uncharacterized protein n=1 Tax=Romanomermis culicivorax TaxID=13658 RepID=A0A915HKN7_ROMCU
MVKCSISKSAKSSSSVLSYNSTPNETFKKTTSTVSVQQNFVPNKKPPAVDVDSISSLSSLQTVRKLADKRRIKLEDDDDNDVESSVVYSANSPTVDGGSGSVSSSVRKGARPSSLLPDGGIVRRKLSTVDPSTKSPTPKKPKIEDLSSSSYDRENTESSIDKENPSSEKDVPTPEIVSESPKTIVPSSQFSSITNCDDQKESKITFFGLTPGHLRSLFNQIKKLKQCFEQHYEKHWNGIHDFEEFCESTRNFQVVITETETFVKNFFENPPIYECSSMEEFYERHCELQEQIELEEMQHEILAETTEFLAQLLSNENLIE